MVARKLTSFVHLTDPSNGQTVAFGPEDEVPAWAAKMIPNPKAWSGPEQVEADDDTKGWADHKLDELKAAIASRNEGREDGDKLPASGLKADLVAALEADDQK